MTRESTVILIPALIGWLGVAVWSVPLVGLGVAGLLIGGWVTR